MIASTLKDLLSDVLVTPELCTWPIFVSVVPDIELLVGGYGEVTSVATGESLRWNEQAARQFGSHPCWFSRSPSGTDRLTIGRSQHNDYAIQHSSVSATHAELVILPTGACQLIDVGSRNGTFVEGRRLTPRDPAEIASSDLVRFGEVTLYMIDPVTVKTLSRVAHPDGGAGRLGG